MLKSSYIDWDTKLGDPTPLEPLRKWPRKEETDFEEPTINPAHYKHLGVECIQMAEHMSFCLGNVVKYVYRCNLKGGVEDLRKARWYLDREIARREGGERNDAGC